MLLIFLPFFCCCIFLWLLLLLLLNPTVFAILKLESWLLASTGFAYDCAWNVFDLFSNLFLPILVHWHLHRFRCYYSGCPLCVAVDVVYCCVYVLFSHSCTLFAFSHIFMSLTFTIRFILLPLCDRELFALSRSIFRGIKLFIHLLFPLWMSIFSVMFFVISITYFFCRILLDFFFIYKNEWNTQTHNLFNYYFFFITQNHFVVSVIFKCIILNISQW